MTKMEEKVLKGIQNNLVLIFFIIASLMAIIIRFPLRNIVTSDMSAYLSWLEQMKSYGGLGGLAYQVGAYNVLFQLFLAILSYIPINPLYLFKALFGFFDYIVALGAAKLALEVCTGSLEVRNRKSLIVYVLVLFSPVVIMNSSAWGQSDSVYVSFVLLSLVALLKDKYKTAMVWLGIALTFKLQAVLIVPFFLFYYFYKKKFSVFNFLLIPVVAVVIMIPKMVAKMINRIMHTGDGNSAFSVITDSVNVYATQTKETGQLYIRYPSFWCFLSDEHGGDYADYYRWRLVAILFTVVVLATIMFYLIYHMKEMNKTNFLYCAFLLSFTCVLFLPSMMDRYSYMYEIMAIVIALRNRKTIPLAVILNVMTMYQYGEAVGKYMFPFPLAVLSMVNVGVYVAYMLLLTKEICSEEKGVENV